MSTHSETAVNQSRVFFWFGVAIVVAVFALILWDANPQLDPTPVKVPAVATTTTTTVAPPTGTVTPATAAPPVTVTVQPAAAPTVAPKRPLSGPETVLTDPEAASAPEGATTTTTTPCFDSTAVMTGLDRCRPTSDFTPDEYFLAHPCYAGSQPPLYIDSDGVFRQPYDGIDPATGQPYPQCVYDPLDP